MNIVVTADNNKELIVFPLIPENPELKTPSNNEEFETINNGTLNLIGEIGLRSINISSIFPKDKKSWAKKGSVEGKNYVLFFEKWRAKKLPVRLIITLKDGSEWVNMPCLIESFDYSYDRQENVRYSLDFKEYKYIS